jgi:hypothetical protein
MSKGNNILNYSTQIEAGRTIGEIVSLLVAKRASSINTDYDEHGRAVALTFVIRIVDNLIPFRMSPNVAGVARKLPNSQDVARAERVAWRILLRWVEAQMAMVESTQAEMGQVFLPYAVQTSGETVWQSFQEHNTKRLAAPTEEAIYVQFEDSME